MNALLIIDMQKAYFKTPGLIQRQADLIAHINTLVSHHRTIGDLVVAVSTIHSRSTTTWTLNMLEDDIGFAFNDSHEIQAVDGLDLLGAKEITKTRDSAFHGTNLKDVLLSHNVARLVLTGVSTHSCIFQTASDAYAHNFPVTIHRGGVDDEDLTLHKQALDYLRQEYRQTIE
jgi:nicotinamidase-related amidase